MSDDTIKLKAADVDNFKMMLDRIKDLEEQNTIQVELLNNQFLSILSLKQIPDMYGDVKTFIEACDQEKSESNSELYKTLMAEEYKEFLDAHLDVNKVEELDACMDLIWVTLGYCYMNGWDVQGAWNEVARSNLSKINSETGKVIKREDGKVLKPEGWTPPSLEQFTK